VYVGVELKGLMVEIKSRKRENCLVLIVQGKLIGLKLSSICAHVLGHQKMFMTHTYIMRHLLSNIRHHMLYFESYTYVVCFTHLSLYTPL